MPTVPYKPVPEVAPSQQAIPDVSISTPIEAFGGGIARAIGSVGQVVEKAGDEIFQRAVALQNLDNETMAKEADAKYVMQLGEIEAKYRSLQGQAAVQAYPKFIREAQLLRQQHRQALPNDITRKMFDGPSLQFMSRTIFSEARHSAAEKRQWALGASRARIEAVRQNSFSSPEDEDSLAGAEATTRAEVRSLARGEGWSTEQTGVEEAKAVSRLHADRIIGLSRQQPLRAWQLFQENRGSLTPDDSNRVEQRVLTQRNTAVAQQIAQEVNPIPQEGGVEEPLRDRLNRAIERAEAIAPGDEHFALVVQNAVRQQYNHNKEVLRNDQQNREAVIIGAINGAHGPRPTTVAKLLETNAEVSGAWDNTTEPRRRILEQMLTNNLRADTRVTDEGRRRFQVLIGMADQDPTAFLATDVLSETGMNNSMLNTLAMRQVRVRLVPGQDPHVQQALRMLGPMMRSADISRADNPQQYNQFVGVLQDALTEFQRTNNRHPRSVEEYNQIGQRLIRTIAQDNAWTGRTWPSWLGGPSRTPFYEQAVPTELMEQFENDPRWAVENRSPTVAEKELFRRQYLQKLDQKLNIKQKPKASSP